MARAGRVSAAEVVAIVCGGQSALATLLSRAGLAGVRVVESKLVELADGALAPHICPDAVVVFRAAGVELLSVTVAGGKPAEGPAGAAPRAA